MYIPLQLRLTCFYVLLLALALWFFGGLIMIQAGQRTYADLDATLSSRAESVRLGKFLGNQQALPIILPGIASVGNEGIAIEVLDTQRHLLATTDGGPADPLQSPLYLEGSKSSPVPWDIQAFQKSVQQVVSNPDLSRGTYSTVSYQSQQVRVVLIDNAVKYTPPKGTISLLLTTEASQAILHIKDTGIGITSEEIPHIFERFYRSPRIREQSGSGLGLAIVQSILHDHQGSITVASIPHEGTTFTVYIPRVEGLST